MTDKFKQIEDALIRAQGCFKECGIGFHSIDEAITAIRELRDERSQEYMINRHEFCQHVDAVLEYHANDKEFCDNYRKDVNKFMQPASDE